MVPPPPPPESVADSGHAEDILGEVATGTDEEALEKASPVQRLGRRAAQATHASSRNVYEDRGQSRSPAKHKDTGLQVAKGKLPFRGDDAPTGHLEGQNLKQREDETTPNVLAPVPMREKYRIPGLSSAIRIDPVRRLDISRSRFSGGTKPAVIEEVVASSRVPKGGWGASSSSSEELKHSGNRSRRSRRIESRPIEKKPTTDNGASPEVIDLDTSSGGNDDSSDNDYNGAEERKQAGDEHTWSKKEDRQGVALRRGLPVKRNLGNVEVLQSGHVRRKISPVHAVLASEKPRIAPSIRRRRPNLIEEEEEDEAEDGGSSSDSSGRKIEKAIRREGYSVAEAVPEVSLNKSVLKRKMEKILDRNCLSATVSREVLQLISIAVRQRVCNVLDSAYEFAHHRIDSEKKKWETAPAGANLSEILEEERDDEERDLVAQKEFRLSEEVQENGTADDDDDESSEMKKKEEVKSALKKLKHDRQRTLEQQRTDYLSSQMAGITKNRRRIAKKLDFNTIEDSYSAGSCEYTVVASSRDTVHSQAKVVQEGSNEGETNALELKDAVTSRPALTLGDCLSAMSEELNMRHSVLVYKWSSRVGAPRPA